MRPRRLRSCPRTTAEWLCPWNKQVGYFDQYEAEEQTFPDDEDEE